jgi:DNA polymerase III subunit delta
MKAVYLLAGEEFLTDEAFEKIRAQAGGDALAEQAFDATVSVPELMTALGTSSLLGGMRVVVIRDAEGLKKDQSEALARYLEAPSPDVVLVLIAQGRTKLDAIVKKSGEVIALDPPKGRRLVSWLRQRGRDNNLKLDDRASWALIESVGTDLRELDNALQQIATANGSGATIGAREIHRAFPRLADERIFALTDAVGERRLPHAMTALRRLLDQGEEPLVVFGSLVAHIRRLLRARRFAEQGASAVGDVLGLPGWRAEKMQKQARAYREEELVAALQELAAVDVELKGELPQEAKEAALESAVVRIVEGTFEKV